MVLPKGEPITVMVYEPLGVEERVDTVNALEQVGSQAVGTKAKVIDDSAGELAANKDTN